MEFQCGKILNNFVDSVANLLQINNKLLQVIIIKSNHSIQVIFYFN